MANYNDIESALIHGGIYGDKTTGAVNVPIYQTSTYEQTGIMENPVWEYSRTGNPTRRALEDLIAELEKGVRGFAFASGMAAIDAVVHLFKSGDEILVSSNVYGGTYRILDKVYKQLGIKAVAVDTSNLSDIEKAITDKTVALYIESPTNPLLTVTDLKAAAKIAKKHNLLTVVDNTFMTPYLQRPIELGADIVVHSATKYLGGHSDLVAGLAVVNSKELASKLAFYQNSVGAVLAPFDSFLLIRGIKTLAVRLDRHTQNAHKLALFLRNHDAVSKVYYPGFEDAQGYEINKAQAKNGGAMISFVLDEKHDVKKFFKSLNLIALAESLGGVESLVCHPATMTHAAIPYDIRQELGITDSLVRLSVGIESFDDLKNDLQKAIKESEI